VCTPSNAAIDELALRLAAGRLGADGSEIGMQPGELVRVGPLDQVSPRAHGLSLDALTDRSLADLAKSAHDGGKVRGDAEARERRSLLAGAQVIAATTAAAGAAFLGSLAFDAVIIDEAAQASESASLVPLTHRGGGAVQVEFSRISSVPMVSRRI
jgi:senataxin